MPLKNLIPVIIITILLTSAFYTNLDNILPFLQKITGYTSIVIYGTVESPQANTGQENTLVATVQQPQKEEPAQTQSQETPQTTAVVEPKQEKKDYVNQTILLQVANQTKGLIIKLDKFRASSRDILEYYSSINDTKNSEKWINVIVNFNQAIDGLEDIRLYAVTVKDSATKEDGDVIKAMIAEAMETLDKILGLVRIG